MVSLVVARSYLYPVVLSDMFSSSGTFYIMNKIFLLGDMPSTMTTSTLSTLTTENSTSSGTTNSPWYKKLVFLDHLSFCHVNKTTSAGQNTVSLN